MGKGLFTLILILISFNLFGQKDSTQNKRLVFSGDFRFRIEHDWNSVKSNGVLREDRSRMRFRFRIGSVFTLDKYSSFGGRIRTGNLNDQQGPHVTLGGDKGEFGLVQMGFEKLFYQFNAKNLEGWIGKNTIPLKKLNELFWNDNVYPEGIGLKYKVLEHTGKLFNQLSINSGYFIIKSSNQTFNNDSYLLITQFDFKLLKNRVNIFPGLYVFREIGNFPDAKHTFTLDYSIFHLGCNINLDNNSKFNLGLELYSNLQDYSNLDSISQPFKNQKNGIVISAKYGELEKKGDWLFHLYYAHLQKFSIVDYFAQNDWVRWDYSNIGATGARISNFQGLEFRVGYAFQEHLSLNLRTYFVEELIKTGAFKENGNRIRLDMNISF